jgi:hypothetical protein
MNCTKNELYGKLRKQLVTQYPGLRKRYKKHELPVEETSFRRKGSNSPSSPHIQSTIRMSLMRLKSEPSEVACLTATQVRHLAAHQ